MSASKEPTRIEFPDPSSLGDADLVCRGGALTPEDLEAAYSRGFYAYPSSDGPLTWHCPARRAVLEFADLHVPRSLAQSWRRHPYRISMDEAFEGVIRGCAGAPRAPEDGNWITDETVEGYVALHRRGGAHSVEVWDGEILIGGLYGVTVGGVFSGESMFHRRSDTSKLAALHLIAHCRSRGHDWIDIQMLTRFYTTLGGKEIPRAEFLRRMHVVRERGRPLFRD